MGTAPNGYQTSKTNWQGADVPLPADFNRIEGNILAVEEGSRTIDPTQVPSSNSGSLRQFLDWLANRIKAITGKANWYDGPDVTLAALAQHKSRHATGGSDALTPADIGAVNKAGDTMTGTLIINAASAPNYLIARASGSIGDQGGLVLDQGATYRFRAIAQGTGSASGTVNLRYEDANKVLGNATLNIDGFAVAKLNGNTVWHAGNDGAGSGLDADTVDGRHGGDFALYYDLYALWLELYYNGTISDLAISTMRAMTFDGLLSFNRISNATTARISTAGFAKSGINYASWVALPTPAYGDETINNPNNMIDLDENTYTSLVCAQSEVYRGIKWDLGSSKNVQRVRVVFKLMDSFWNGSYLRVQGSSDATNWYDIATIAMDASLVQTIDQNVNVTYRYYRIVFNVSGSGASKEILRFFEVSLLGTTSYPFATIDTYLVTSTKQLTFNPTYGKVFFTALKPANTNIVPQMSIDGGLTWINMSLVSSRTDPRDATYTEYEYECTLPGNNNQWALRFVFSTTDVNTSATLKRYGAYVA